MPGLPAPGAVWGGLRIETELGRGGATPVFAARDASGRRVVVRAVDPALGPAAADRFLHQWTLVEQLAHPRIVPVVRSDTVDGVAHVVTEYVDGSDLAEEIARSPLTLDRASSVVAQVAGALDRAHRAGLVHGRVEPGAILCAADGHVVLTGFAAWDGPASPHHRPPEADDRDPPTPAADLYALGCVLYECLTGRVPFRGASDDEVARQHREAPRPRVTDLRPDLPPSVDLVVSEAMAVDPTRRYATARAMADALRVVATTSTAPAVPVGPAPAETTAVIPEVAAPSVFEEATVTSAVLAGDRRRRVVDGALYGVYEEEDPTSRAPAIVAAVIAVLVLIVGILVWRAVNTDAELTVPAATSTTSTTRQAAPLTVEELRLLVPPGVDGCEPPEQQPTDRPRRVELVCTGDDTPRTTTVVLYATVDGRDRAFDDAVAALGVTPDGECALGGPAVHDYIGVERVGRVACRGSSEGISFVWTSDEAPLLLHATGPGSYPEHYRSWAAVVDRIDAAFPLPVERELLDQLPERFVEDCERDLDLLVEAGGQAAAQCRPEGPVDSVWWVRFADATGMGAWIEGRRRGLQDNVFSDADDACTAEGFGRRPPAETPPTTEAGGAPDTTDPDASTTTTTTTTAPPPPRPDAGFTAYDLAGRTGTILCFIDGQDRPIVVWVRDGPRVGSVAIADRGRSMADLLRWWEGGGHLP